MSADAQTDIASLAQPEQAIAVPEAPARRRWRWPRSANGFSDDEALAPDALADDEEDVRARSWVPIAMIAVLTVAFLARLSAADHLSSQIDEAASVLAAQRVAHHGLPIFPSKIPYFQGATLSYLLAPFVWLGYGDLQDLDTMRFVGVIAGVLMVFFVYKLGRELTEEAWPAVLAAGMVAVEPMSIRWSGYLRMYAPLQMFSAMFAYCYALVILRGPTRKRIAAVVVVFWLGIFTHIAMALIWPAMVVIALVTYRRQLRYERRDISVMLGLCLLAPVALSAANRLTSSPDLRVSHELPVFSFVGDHVLSGRALINPDFESWNLLFVGSALVHIMPYLFFGITFLLIGIYLVRKPKPEERKMRGSIGFLLAFYWIPILLVAVLTNEPQERYVIHFQAFGFLLVALGIQALVQYLPAVEAETFWQAKTFRWSGYFLLVLMVIHLGSGIHFLSQNTILDPDYVSASEYVTLRHKSGEKIIVGLSPAPYLALGSADDLIFMPGPLLSLRTQRYTRINEKGERIDYWAGAPTIVSTSELCHQLLDHPDTWIIIDQQRLSAVWAYRGEMSGVIRGLTYEAYHGPGDVLVMRVKPLPSRSTTAERLCLRNMAAASPQG
ncbi:MAG: glycosyltransferase family 39 protein [Thermomicrobiales bacterium]